MDTFKFYFTKILIMANWLVITNLDNWEIIKNKQIWGVSKKNVLRILLTEPGDNLIVYVKKGYPDNTNPPKLTGIFEIVSQVYYDDNPLFCPPQFDQNENFPFRVELKEEKIFEPAIRFSRIVDHLTFITNKRNWPIHLRGKTMISIPNEDYEFISQYKE